MFEGTKEIVDQSQKKLSIDKKEGWVSEGLIKSKPAHTRVVFVSLDAHRGVFIALN